MGCKNIEIRKSEFAAKTQFFRSKNMILLLLNLITKIYRLFTEINGVWFGKKILIYSFTTTIKNNVKIG